MPSVGERDHADVDHVRATVHGEHDPGDERGVGRSQELDTAGDLGWVGRPA